jgi:hypothetical protein
LDRRDFLLLRSRPKSREVKLSCEWLYMKCLDTQVTGQLSGQSLESAHSSQDDGEGPAVFDARTTKELFEDLDRQLRDADTVRVTNMRWLSGDLRREFGSLLRAFRARGGKIQIEG